MKSLKLKSLALAAGLTFTALSASAATYSVSTDPLFPGEFYFGHSFNAGSIDDLFTGIKFDSAQIYDASLTSTIKIAQGASVSFSVFELLNSSGVTVATASSVGGDIGTTSYSSHGKTYTTSFADFSGLDGSGNYTLHVVGLANNIGTYGGTLSANAAPVPEPETYGMMLAGLGLMGFVARRRKNS